MLPCLVTKTRNFGLPFDSSCFGEAFLSCTVAACFSARPFRSLFREDSGLTTPSFPRCAFCGVELFSSVSAADQIEYCLATNMKVPRISRGDKTSNAMKGLNLLRGIILRFPFLRSPIFVSRSWFSLPTARRIRVLTDCMTVVCDGFFVRDKKIQSLPMLVNCLSSSADNLRSFGFASFQSGVQR